MAAYDKADLLTQVESANSYIPAWPQVKHPPSPALRSTNPFGEPASPFEEEDAQSPATPEAEVEFILSLCGHAYLFVLCFGWGFMLNSFHSSLGSGHLVVVDQAPSKISDNVIPEKNLTVDRKYAQYAEVINRYVPKARFFHHHLPGHSLLDLT